MCSTLQIATTFGSSQVYGCHWPRSALILRSVVKCPLLTHHYIDQAQYTALVTVVILTAIIPTAIAQALFKPEEEPQEMEAEVP